MIHFGNTGNLSNDLNVNVKHNICVTMNVSRSCIYNIFALPRKRNFLTFVHFIRIYTKIFLPPMVGYAFYFASHGVPVCVTPVIMRRIRTLSNCFTEKLPVFEMFPLNPLSCEYFCPDS